MPIMFCKHGTNTPISVPNLTSLTCMINVSQKHEKLLALRC